MRNPYLGTHLKEPAASFLCFGYARTGPCALRRMSSGMKRAIPFGNVAIIFPGVDFNRLRSWAWPWNIGTLFMGLV